MLEILLKQYTQELFDFLTWEQQYFFNNTLLGKFWYRVGQALALVWIYRLVIAQKNLIYPNYSTESGLYRTLMYLKYVPFPFGLTSSLEEDELYWQLVI
mmetsp:Transcript_31498/g.30824  ORF Transcript_31498/g.30824 Transcript_31498/m.30824 type:complete len:99 (-) Transcript_31498:326-622(-)